MKLPWNQKIEELEKENQELQEKIQELEEEKESFQNRFEAEKERRSKLSSEKQEAQEKINKLQQKIDNSSTTEKEESISSEKPKSKGLKVSETKRILEKLDSVQSPEEDLTTVKAPKKLSKLSDVKGLKSSISGRNYSFISDDSSFIAFLDEDFFSVKLKARPFFSEDWSISDGFDVEEFTSFISEKKRWAAVSAGDTVIFEEEDGEILERREVGSRVDSKQKKGGFSQGRFERKRQKQIDEHLELVEEEIDEETLLVGEESLCKKLPGKYLGGFDRDRNDLDALYNFRIVTQAE